MPNTSNQPSLVCHRGSTLFGPENSLRSAAGCFRCGYEFVEIDVHTSADGHPVVIHDTTVDRVTDGTGAVSEMKLAELKRLNLTDLNGDPTGERIPKLDEMLAMAETGQGFMVEIKNADPAQVVESVNRFGLGAACFYWSFDADKLIWLRKNHPDASLMARARDHSSIENTLGQYAPNVVEFEFDLHDRSLVEQAQEMDVKTMVYAQHGYEAEVANALSWGFDLVNTDRPELFRQGSKSN